MNGWEVIGVVEKKSGALTKLDSRIAASDKELLKKATSDFAAYGKDDKRSKVEFKVMNH